VRTFGLIGDPVAHSLSPAMHRAGFAAIGASASYDLVRVPADEPAAVGIEMRRLAAGGGGNVTVPHKRVAALAVDHPSATVTALGSCNCFWEMEAGIVAGDNTDVTGICRSLDAHLAGRPPGRVLVLGAGGAAGAAALSVALLGASKVLIANRTGERARDLATRLQTIDVAVECLDGSPTGVFDLIINATSLGLRDEDPLPAGFDRLSVGLILDLVYGHQRTAWLLAADAAGIECIDGREVLLQQGAACYPHWFGVEAPLDAMRSALYRDQN